MLAKLGFAANHGYGRKTQPISQQDWLVEKELERGFCVQMQSSMQMPVEYNYPFLKELLSFFFFFSIYGDVCMPCVSFLLLPFILRLWQLSFQMSSNAPWLDY